MDKSEGKDFLSKTFSSFTEKIAKIYHVGQKKVSQSSLIKDKNEKLIALGSKVYALIEAGETVTEAKLKNELKDIKSITKQIDESEAEIQKIQKVKTGAKGDIEVKDLKGAPAKTASKSTTKKSPAKKTTAKKPAAKKPAVAKTATKTVAKTTESEVNENIDKPSEDTQG